VIANKINSMIVNNRKNALIKANSSNVGQLWALLRKSENWGSKSKKIDCCGNVNDINKYFTSVVFDKEYSREAVLTELQCQLRDRDVAHTVLADYTDIDIMIILAKVSKTAAGSDDQYTLLAVQ